MKTLLLFLLTTICFASYAQQWQGTNPIYFNAGKVGIGTTNPGYQLEVNSNAAANLRLVSKGSTSYYPSIDLFDDTHKTEFVVSPSLGKVDLFTYSNHALALGTLNTERMRIAPDGKVGIGTTNPLYQLQINSTAAGNLRLISNGSTSYYPSIDLFDDTHKTEFVVSPSLGKVDLFTYSNHALALGTVNTERIRITPGGNVGIGTQSPASKLHISDGTGGEQLCISRGTGAVRFVQELDRNNLYLYNKDASQMYMVWRENGNVGIGTTDPKGYKLAVAGKAIAEEVTVKLQANWPDYVFEPTYHLSPLDSIKTYIDKNKHLPEVPSAKEMEKNGVNLGEMNMLLLKKIEELTLYVIELKKENAEEKEEIKRIKIEVNQ